MTIIHTTDDDFGVEQLPIEQIEPGDTIITNTDDGTPYVYQVYAKRFVHNRAAGEPPMIMLQGKPQPGVELVPQSAAPVGTLAHRIIPKPILAQESNQHRMTTAPDPNYRHPKCYANTHGGCSTKISGEHYVSLGLIKLYGSNDPNFTIQHKTGKGVGHPVQPKNFKANILCRDHNTALSAADDAALAFATFLRRNALQYDAGAGEWGDAEEITVSGEDMQRWVLKVFLNHAVTEHFDVQQRKTVTFPPEAIDLLLDRAAWPSTWGLTVPGDPSNKDVRYCPFQLKDVVNSHWWGVAPFVHRDETWLGGAVVDLAHVSFGLTLFNPGRESPLFNHPDNPIRGSLQRPSYVSWALDGVEKRINFTWDYPLHHLGITYSLRPQNKVDRLAGKLPVGHHIWLE